MLQTSSLLMKSLNKTEIVSKGNLFDIYFTRLQVMFVPCGGRRTSPLTSPQCRLYFISFGTIGSNMRILENKVLLMYTLEGVGSVAKFITAYYESQ